MKYTNMKRGVPDVFQTPGYAISPLLAHIPKDWIVWESACGKGNLKREFEKQGYKVIGTDINSGHDFRVYEPDKYDCVVTNPPYSIKQEFLSRCYQLGKPFALLLPLTALETRKRQELFESNGVEIVLLDKRINFETPNGRGGDSWFSTAWFTWGLNIGSTLSFYKLSNR